jgi:hypothetical protein
LLDADESGGRLELGVDRGVENVDPALLVGILVGVPSSLTSESVEPCRDAGLLVPGVMLDLTGIDVLLVKVVVRVLDGVRRPKDAESD